MLNTSTEIIWETFHTGLARFVQNRIDDPDAAQDVLQDVYLRIHQHVHTLRDETRVQAWVFQVARNAVHDHYRAAAYTRVAYLPDDMLAELPAAAPDVEESSAYADLRGGVRAMLALLPAEYQEALILTEYDGLTQKELAERLGISLSGAKSRVQRARKMLREHYLACCHFHFDRYGQVIDYQPHCDCCTDGCDGC